MILKKIIDKNYYSVQGVIEENTFSTHNVIYEELSSNKEKIRIVETLKTVNDDVELCKEVEDLKKSLQSFNIGALSIDQKKFREQRSKLKIWMVAVETMIAQLPTNFMLHARSSIEIQHMNVTWIRLEFNVSKITHGIYF